jgi:hypothetical protein
MIPRLRTSNSKLRSQAPRGWRGADRGEGRSGFIPRAESEQVGARLKLRSIRRARPGCCANHARETELRCSGPPAGDRTGREGTRPSDERAQTSRGQSVRITDAEGPPVGAMARRDVGVMGCAKSWRWAGSVGFSPCASFSFYFTFPFSDLYFPISFEFKFHT